MSTLVDTNILVRLSDASHSYQPVCEQALQTLLERQERAFLCAQAAIEYWVVATRPKSVNGLGLSQADAEMGLQRAERWLVGLPEPPLIAVRWRALVNQYAVIGKQAHDTRLVAFMELHGLTHILTLNAGDFARYKGITVLHPADVK